MVRLGRFRSAPQTKICAWGQIVGLGSKESWDIFDICRPVDRAERKVAHTHAVLGFGSFR